MLAGILLTAVLSRTAIAAPEASEVHPVRPLSVALAFMGRFGALDGVPEHGAGPHLEVALGAGRSQYFVEGGLGWMRRGVEEPGEAGFMVRGGLGARYIARSFTFQGEGAVELLLDGLVGVEKTWWHDDAAESTIVRPEFALGVGLQMRKYEDPRVVIRFGLRVFFAPTDHDEPAAAARGTSGPRASLTNGGLIMTVGGAL